VRVTTAKLCTYQYPTLLAALVDIKKARGRGGFTWLWIECTNWFCYKSMLLLGFYI